MPASLLGADVTSVPNTAFICPISPNILESKTSFFSYYWLTPVPRHNSLSISKDFQLPTESGFEIHFHYCPSPLHSTTASPTPCLSDTFFLSVRCGLLAVQGTHKSLPHHHSSKASILWRSAFFIFQLSHPYDYSESHCFD